MRQDQSNWLRFAVLGVCIALGGCKGSSGTIITLADKDIPFEKLYYLKGNDDITCMLPSGRRLLWHTAQDQFGSAEQTTACGLKAHIQQPDFGQLQKYGVSTSGNEEISIYSFDIDGYHVERAEDLRATQCLPVVVRVSKSGGSEMDHAVIRALFDAHPPATGPALRVPIGTVHDGLNKQFKIPIRLVSVNDNISFEVSGLLDVSEEKRLATVMDMEKYVVDHLDGIDRLAEFSIVILDGEKRVMTYAARKDAGGVWTVVKVP